MTVSAKARLISMHKLRNCFMGKTDESYSRFEYMGEQSY